MMMMHGLDLCRTSPSLDRVMMTTMNRKMRMMTIHDGVVAQHDRGFCTSRSTHCIYASQRNDRGMIIVAAAFCLVNRFHLLQLPFPAMNVIVVVVVVVGLVSIFPVVV